MSEKSYSPSLIVEYDGNILYDSMTALDPCSTVRDVKCHIEKHHNMPVGSQMLSFENVLLADNITPEDLGFKFKGAADEGNSHGTKELNRPVRLALTLFKAIVNLKVSIISNKNDPIKQVMDVHGAISNFQLRETLLRKLPDIMQQKGKDTQVVLFVKKK